MLPRQKYNRMHRRHIVEGERRVRVRDDEIQRVAGISELLQRTIDRYPEKSRPRHYQDVAGPRKIRAASGSRRQLSKECVWPYRINPYARLNPDLLCKNWIISHESRSSIAREVIEQLPKCCF